MIEKTNRTYTEKTTSIDQDIELSQKGIVSIGTKHAAVVLPVLTNIKFPKALTITPMNHPARQVFSKWHCDLVLYHATNASIATMAKKATAGSNVSGGYDALVLLNGKWYISNPTTVVSGTWVASNSLVTASSSLFKKIDWIASNEAKVLKVAFIPGATLASKAVWKNVRFAYEVRGY